MHAHHKNSFNKTMATPDSAAADFLKIAHQFKLGMLATEAFHPKTVGLSHLSQTDLPKAISILLELDLDLLRLLEAKFDSLDTQKLIQAFQITLKNNKRIFLCGCGATGRLSLAIETLWRQYWDSTKDPEAEFKKSQVVGFMAGGDVALIKAVEDFEDHPEFALQHLLDLGYSEGDLLIASTESGVTPWVIGAAQYGASKYVEKSTQKPFFVYCNPDQVLIENVQRAKDVLVNPNIEKLNACVGPMAVTGSTRMQASTAVMYLLGLCLFLSHKSTLDKSFNPVATGKANVKAFYEFLAKTDLTGLTPFIETESKLYKEANYLFYETTPNYAITVLTDTTERSPTFSLYPFENAKDPDDVKSKRHSLCHLLVAGEEKVDVENYREHSKNGWKSMLGGRDVRPLEGKFWEKYKNIVSEERIYGHIFTKEIVQMRSKYCRQNATHQVLRIEKVGTSLVFSLYDAKEHDRTVLMKTELDVTPLGNDSLLEHIFLKIALNIQSTLVMGRMGRYESNLMTYVRPSNNKLIDRSIRYVMHLINQHKTKVPAHLLDDYNKIGYKEICYELFRQMPMVGADEPIVLKTFNAITAKYLHA